MSARDADAPHEERSTAVDWEAVTPKTWYARHGHALLDVILLIAVSIPALLLMTVIALCNLITFGHWRKIFFKQPRLGQRGHLFELYKFRTMRDATEGNFCAWREGDKARVTAFGRLLRSTHLDELPQIINILKGEMSFIGPRPEMLEIEQWANENIPGFEERLAIKPGITGLAQISQGYTGCDVPAYTEKLNICLVYMSRMSLWLDIQIVFGTVIWMLKGKGWHWQAQEQTNAVIAVAK